MMTLLWFVPLSLFFIGLILVMVVGYDELGHLILKAVFPVMFITGASFIINIFTEDESQQNTLFSALSHVIFYGILAMLGLLIIIGLIMFVFHIIEKHRETVETSEQDILKRLKTRLELDAVLKNKLKYIGVLEEEAVKEEATFS